MSNFITTHSASGEPTFDSTISPSHHTIPMPGGSQQIIYTVHNALPLDLSSPSDLDQYAQDRTSGLPAGQISPPSGSAAGIITFDGGAESPMHRTMTMDIGYVIEGVVELRLGNEEEVKVLKAGDTYVQRGTLHGWKNVTPGGGEVKMFCVAYGAVSPIRVGGKELETQWGM